MPMDLCHGCVGSTTSAFNNGPACLVITFQNLTCAHGECSGNNDPCSMVACRYSGTVTIDNGCTSTIWLVEKNNTDCGAKQGLAAGGQLENVYTNLPLTCGITRLYRVYTSDPGSTCPTSSVAGWGFQCTECDI
jgi:hypothetical protein